MAHEIHISVVSHDHGAHIEQLLGDLADLPNAGNLQLTLTQNIPETLHFDLSSLPFPAKLLTNASSTSFAKNHNIAFQQPPIANDAQYFVVLNPDVRLASNIFEHLVETLEQQRDHNIALLGPAVFDEHGEAQSTGRIFPDFYYLLRKLLGREPGNPVTVVDGIARVDWVAGMCLVLHRETFAQLHGFDEQYRLYYEDVDLCLRLRQQDRLCAIAADIHLQHQGQWRSRRNLRHFYWHCQSVLRFLRKQKRLAKELPPLSSTAPYKPS